MLSLNHDFNKEKDVLTIYIGISFSSTYKLEGVNLENKMLVVNLSLT